MALIKCPECGSEVSDKAVSCIHCGYPLAQHEEISLSEYIESVLHSSKFKNEKGYVITIKDGKTYRESNGRIVVGNISKDYDDFSFEVTEVSGSTERWHISFLTLDFIWFDSSLMKSDGFDSQSGEFTRIE